MKIIEFVRQFAALGIAIMPLYHRSKVPCLPSWERYTTILSTDLELQQWFATDWCNYGVIAGWNNLVILDFDSLFYFSLWAEWGRAVGLGHVVENSFKVITCNGMHVYLRTVAPSCNDKRIARSGGIDIQAQGKYVVGPWSTHPSGDQYVPVGTLRLIEVPSVEAVLPLDLFPRVAPDSIGYAGAPVQVQRAHTEYQDPLQFATMDLISKVKASVRIESLYAGVQRSSTDGRWLKALCPFHKDAHQSAWIDTVKQLAGCQVCGMKPMDVINVYARMHHMSDRDAINAMAAELGVWR